MIRPESSVSLWPLKHGLEMAEIIIQKHWAWYQCLVNLPFVEQALAVLLELLELLLLIIFIGLDLTFLLVS